MGGGVGWEGVENICIIEGYEGHNKSSVVRVQI